MMLRRPNSLCHLLPAAVLLLAGCNLPQPEADTSRHFTLSGPAAAVAVAEGTMVRPVQLAAHLQRRTMAVRVAENEVTYLEDVRWAEPLDEGVTQILRARLGGVASGCSISVQVQRCELVRFEGNQVQLTATYEITPPGGDPSRAKRGAFAATPRVWDGKDYGALVGLIRQAVGELGDALVTALPEKSVRN